MSEKMVGARVSGEVRGWDRNFPSLGTLGIEGCCRMHQKPGKQIIFC